METIKMNERISYEKYFTLNPREAACLRNNAPEDLKALVYNIHQCFDVLPNDWIYMQIANAFEELEDNLLDDITIEADSYYNDLYKWLGEPFAKGCIEDYMSDFSAKTTDIYEMIASGQWVAKNRIYQMVNEFINEGEE